MIRTSVLIPSRNCHYLARTVRDLFEKASEPIEVIALMDNFWPNPIPDDNPNLIMVHKGSVGGMRDSINRGAQLAHGEFLLKTDDHCMFSEGWDRALIDACDENTLCVP